jgi:hypothetical protein
MLTQAKIDEATQRGPLANTDWVKGFGDDFAIK